ncbi:hypothetical protein AOC36_09045 [Erysipelothrix larvae]|uniref:Gram-positive cocci surface proteins LPxTG domain-containing protein n=1 Tax=Erysipelothrix larvae TaxID=1514105 RepID=A0A0X8H199_9FIRM|nr:Cna B-type domain-containing protein [Erysipelothrix larvae]AMC94129.1 hypothetical protein AOC36_09045 [Erysipelothrix larvae]
MNRKIMTFILASLLAFSSLISSSTTHALDDGSLGGNQYVKITTNSNGEGERSEYRSHEQITFYVSANISALVTNEEGSKLTVTIPKQYIPKDSITYHKDGPIKGITLEEDETSYKIIYDIGNLGTAGSISTAITINTEDGNTPDGYTFNVAADYETNNKVTIGKAEKEYVIVTEAPTFKKAVFAGNWQDVDGKVAPAGIPDENDPTILSKDPSKLRNVAFSYKLNRTENYGNRFYSQILVSDILPEGAEFVQEHNEDWTYDEKTRIVTYTYNLNEPSMLKDIRLTPYLHVIFPGGALDKDYTNSATLTLVPHEKKDFEQNKVVSDSITFKLGILEQYRLTKSTLTTVFDIERSKEQEVLWNVVFKNLALQDNPESQIYNISLMDFNLDSNLKYSKIKVPRSYNYVGTYSIYLDYGDKTEALVEKQPATTAFEKEIPDGVQNVTLKSDGDGYLKGGDRSLSFEIYTKFIDPTKKILNAGEKTRSLENSARVTGHNGLNDPIDIGITGKLKLTDGDPQAFIKKTIIGEDGKQWSEGNCNFVPGSTIHFKLEVNVKDIVGETILKTNALVDILPMGLEYIGGSATVSFPLNNFDVSIHSSTLREPYIYRNFMDTGLTSISWLLKDIKGSDVKPNSWNIPVVITYSAMVTNDTPEGLNTNQSILSWTNSDVVKPVKTDYSRIVSDIYNITSLGTGKVLLSQSDAKFNYLPDKVLFISKKVKGDADRDFVAAPLKGTSSVGGTATYRIHLKNYTDEAFSEITLIDLLPTPNDRTVAKDSQDARVNRNSTFNVKLAGPISKTDKFEVFYTTTIPTEDMHDFNSNASWVSQPKSFAAVTALKIVLRNDQKLDVNEEAIFDIPVNVPDNPILGSKDVAINSVGLLTPNSEDFLESNFAILTLSEYTIDGYVFFDEDADGIFDPKTNDQPIKPYTVTLYDSQNRPIDRVDTDANGYYQFITNKAGSYRVAVPIHPEYDVTRLGTGPMESHVKRATNDLSSEAFTLSLEKPTARVNAGFISVYTGLAVFKTVKNEDGALLDIDESFEFELLIDGSPYNGGATFYSGGTEKPITITDGLFYLKNAERIAVFDLRIGSTYSVTEAFNERYKVSPQSRNLSGTLTSDAPNIVFDNVYQVPFTELILNKVWEGGPSPRPDIEVTLYQNDVVYLDHIVISGESGTTIIRDIPLTDKKGNPYVYTIDEKNVPQNYTKSRKDLTITNTYVIPKIDITVEKMWEGGHTDRPEIQVQLYRDQIALGDPVTFSAGKVSHTWGGMDETDINGVKYTYTVDEVNVPAHYTKRVDNFIITNTYVIPKIDITVEKMWEGGQTDRPEIQVQLYRDKIALGDPVTFSAGKVSHTWGGMDETDINGVKYTYTVDEVNVPAHYTKRVADFVITNTYVIPKIDITVEKMWVGGHTNRPEIQVQLYRDQVALGDPVTFSAGKVSHTWSGMDETDTKGVKYTYTVDEVNVPENYTKRVENFKIINTYVSPKRNIDVWKEWVGGSDDHPTIELQLYRNDVPFGTPITLVNGVEKFTFINLDVTDQNGVNYEYRVDEVTVLENYAKRVEGFVISNTYVIPKTNLVVNKVWDGGPTTHPSIQVQLYRDGLAVDTPITLVNGVLTYTWFDLDATDANGKAYVYSVDEVNVPANYQKRVNGLTITNTYRAPIIPDTGKKTIPNPPVTPTPVRPAPVLPSTGMQHDPTMILATLAVVCGLGLILVSIRRKAPKKK